MSSPAPPVRSEPITIPGANPHIVSWRESLSQKITEKETQISVLQSKMKTMQRVTDKQKENLESLFSSIEGTLDQVQTSVEMFSKNIYTKIRETKKTLKTLEGSDEVCDLSPLQFRGHHLFVLFKDLYKEAGCFFSKREFDVEPFQLKEEKKKKPVDHQSWLDFLGITDDIGEDPEWLDWLAPIWSLEEHYKMALKEFKKAEGLYKIDYEKLKRMRDKFDKLKNELGSLEKERDAVHSFSEHITKISRSADSNISNGSEEFYDAPTGAVEIQDPNPIIVSPSSPSSPDDFSNAEAIET